MNFIKKIVLTLMFLFIGVSLVNATQEQVNIQISEFVDQTVIVNPLNNFAGTGIWADANENQSYYVLTGFINISNSNPNGKTISDIYVSFDYTTNITLPTLVSGRAGTFISNDTSSNNLIIHIPELNSGEFSYWTYSINTTSIRPPLNFTTTYSDSKVLAGDNVTLTDTVENVFDNAAYQTNTCIYGINITQRTVPVNFSGTNYDFYFAPSSTAGSDSSNVTYAASNLTQYWDTLGGACMAKGSTTDINYIIQTPLNIPSTKDYTMVNTTLVYKLNQSISQLRVIDITAISEGKIDFEKKIIKPSDPILYGSNVTWNVTGYFNTDTNITYNLSEVTIWVARRTGGNPLGDPNTIDNDTISNASLVTIVNPNVLVNSSLPWSSASWLFNYSDIPSPIVWMDINFTIDNDGTQLINRSVTQNGDDIYIKELYLIIGYWLEINKNITSISGDKYHVRIDVHNKGNQVTPADTVVTIYDFVPSNYVVEGNNFVFSDPGWYDTTEGNHSINGEYNGTLFQWGLLPTNSLNTSFAQGPTINENTTWSVDYNVTGQGDYTLLDVFVTGLDPQQVDGAGSSKSVIVSEFFNKLKSTEGIFAVVASVLLLFGLIL